MRDRKEVLSETKERMDGCLAYWYTCDKNGGLPRKENEYGRPAMHVGQQQSSQERLEVKK